MADTTVPIQSASLKFNEDGELKTAGAGGSGGGTTAGTATTTTVSLSAATATLLLAANDNRKGFTFFAGLSSPTYVLFGGVDENGDVIPSGDGAVSASNYTIVMGTIGSGVGLFYESGATVYTGAITMFSPGTPTAYKVTELT
jgi:hypothetical protein